MLRQLRHKVVKSLWDNYRLTTPDMQRIDSISSQQGMTYSSLDHFAVIDLPGPGSGIPFLYQIFHALGYVERGKDYLADKQNDFLWMAEADCIHQPAIHALPQVVIADFRPDEMPMEIRNIIHRYAAFAANHLHAEIMDLLNEIKNDNQDALIPCTNKLLHYFSGREWPAPTVGEFHTVREFNELLAWVLVFGRRPNHFTLSIHLLNRFKSLEDFHHFIETEVQLKLNHEGGTIKGGKLAGLAQGSTVGILQRVKLADGEIEIPSGFVEFIWRYSENPAPLLWKDYFTDFIGQNANKVIESLYDFSQ